MYKRIVKFMKILFIGFICYIVVINIYHVMNKNFNKNIERYSIGSYKNFNYYVDNKGKIYKIKNKHEQIMNSVVVSNKDPFSIDIEDKVMIIKNCIYYIDVKDEKLHCFNLDTQIHKKIIDSRLCHPSCFKKIFLYYKNYIIYEDENDHKFYKVSLEGGKKHKITKNQSSGREYYKKGNIYYMSTKGYIFKANIKYITEINLLTNSINCFEIYNDLIFYECNNSVYRININGKNKKIIGKFSCFQTQIVDDWIYYWKIKYGKNIRDESILEIYRISINGENLTRLLRIKCFQPKLITINNPNENVEFSFVANGYQYIYKYNSIKCKFEFFEEERYYKN